MEASAPEPTTPKGAKSPPPPPLGPFRGSDPAQSGSEPKRYSSDTPKRSSVVIVRSSEALKRGSTLLRIVLPQSCSQVSKLIIENRIKSMNQTGCQRIWGYFLSYQIPIMMLLFTIFGLAVPQPGTWLSAHNASTYLLIIIFFMSGFVIKTDDLRAIVNHKLGLVVCFVCNVFASSFLSFIILAIGYKPEISFPLGLSILLCGPCALSSGVILTDIAGGNIILALISTVLSNVVGILIEPFILTWVFSSFNLKVKIDINSVIIKITYSFIAPLIVGKMASYIPHLMPFYERFKTGIKLATNVCLIMIPWMNVSTSAKRILGSSAADIFFCLGMSIFVNFLLLALNFTSAFVTCLPTEDKKANVLVCSGKSVSGAVVVLSFLPVNLLNKGLAVIPIIMTYLISIFANSFVCSLWVKYEQRKGIPQISRSLTLPEEVNTKPIIVDDYDVDLDQPMTLPPEIIRMPTFIEMLTTITGEH